MSSEYSELLGEYGGRPYFLTVRAKPNFDRPREFAAVVHYDDSRANSQIEIARIDTAHGHLHFDKLYRRDEPKEPLDADLWDAVARLKENWRRYAESYERRR